MVHLRPGEGVLLGAATVLAVVLVTGVSFAYWSATGAGAATISSTTAQLLGVSATTPVVADLYPGKAMQDLSFVVSNPNPYPVAVTGATLGLVASNDSVNCPTSNLTWTPGPFTVNAVVPAASAGVPGTVTVSVPSVVQMKSSAADGCQGKTFTFPVAISGTQQ